MNNIKKLALGLLVAAFAFGFSAFTNKSISTTGSLTSDWYAPIDEEMDPESLAASVFENYHSEPLDVAPVDVIDCPGDDYVCAARFPDTDLPPTTIFSKD